MGDMNLLGSEQVERAASRMVQAAESIRQSVGHFEEALRQDQQRRNEDLERLWSILAEDREKR